MDKYPHFISSEYGSLGKCGKIVILATFLKLISE